MLSSFRNRYTSARNLAFRSPTNYDEDTFVAAAATTTTNNTTFPSSIEAGTVLVEIQFTGPQLIEGSAGLLCTLLQSTFVAAYTIQLGRGRKRKVRAGAALPFASSAPGHSNGEKSTLGSALTRLVGCFRIP